MEIKIVIPSMGESVTEGEISEWLKKEGEPVKTDEPIVVIETDKVTVELPAPASGVLAKILKGPGSVVPIGEVIGIIESAAIGAAGAEKKIAPAVLASAPQAAAAASGEAETPLSPAVRRMIEESGADPAGIEGSGPEGRILKSDVVEFLEKRAREAESRGVMARIQKSLEDAVQDAADPKKVQGAKESPFREEERVRMTRMRLRTAERLLASQRETASLTTFNDVDMSAVLGLRAKYKDLFQKKYGISLGFMSFFVKACIEALKAYPAINAMIDGEDIVYRNYYDVGVAVSTDKGLVVPIVRNAETLSFAETETAVADLAKRAREGRLTIEELTGGTFSITNGGVFGSLLSTPILNPPQSGILGMHRVEKRPVVREDDEIVVRPMMYLALTYDHRIVDGREAVSFLVRVKQCIEDPTRILVEV